MLTTAHRLYGFFQKVYATFQPGDESALVDAWAKELNVQEQCEWIRDYVGFKLACPELDTAIPLDDAYQSTLEHHNRVKGA